jgi:hypothetical protein
VAVSESKNAEMVAGKTPSSSFLPAMLLLT